MNKTQRNILIGVLLGFLFPGCEDVIEVSTQDAEAELVVDAWLTNQSQVQEIHLSRSQPYFDNQRPTGINNAVVELASSGGQSWVFEGQGAGVYSWTPNPGQQLGAIGDTFFLEINWEGQTYTSVSVLNRVPAIDSIAYEFREDELFGPDGIYAEVYARDFVGRGDTYWIKTFKNGVYLNKPAELNIAFDAGFDPGSRIDGLIFIPPIRELINRVPDPDGEEDDIDVPPYDIGDSIRVEIHSLNLDAFRFLETARDQMRNGENTIFAIPIANTRGNVFNLQTREAVLGIFCVSAVSSLEIEVE